MRECPYCKSNKVRKNGKIHQIKECDAGCAKNFNPLVLKNRYKNLRSTFFAKRKTHLIFLL